MQIYIKYGTDNSIKTLLVFDIFKYQFYFRVVNALFRYFKSALFINKIKPTYIILSKNLMNKLKRPKNIIKTLNDPLQKTISIKETNNNTILYLQKKTFLYKITKKNPLPIII